MSGYDTEPLFFDFSYRVGHARIAIDPYPLFGSSGGSVVEV